MPHNMKRVLVLCTHNSSRSQIAEGLINHFHQGKITALSAGTVKTSVSSYAIKVMAEIGIDIHHHISKTIEQVQDEKFDLVVTVCDSAKKNCPIFSAKMIHKSFKDPNLTSEEEKLNQFRNTREEIKKWVLEQLPNLLDI